VDKSYIYIVLGLLSVTYGEEWT